MDALFSDTFENISFTDSVNLRTVNFNRVNESESTDAENSPISNSLRANISLDDSVFFADSFTSSATNKINQSSNVDSEDLFSDSENSFDSTHSKYLNSRANETNNSHSQLQSKLCPGEPEALPCQTDKCDLSAWGLPNMVLEKYASRNITSMFMWQSECLSRPHVLDRHKNLVYSAPTSAGKTLVAEILAIKTLFERNKKVLFILPFVSVVREKMVYFQDILNTSEFRVEGFMGSYNPPGGFHSIHVAICTMEKANSLVNRLLDANALSDVGMVVIDELHLVGDPGRGYLLELLLTKLKYMSAKDDNVKIQIVGMSATLPNLEVLAKWLNAELYTTTFRPVPLHELCCMNGDVYDSKLQFKRKLPTLPDVETDTDNILQLCLETIENSCSVLIFCPTKNWCENLAQQIASAIWKLGSSATSTLGGLLRQQLNATLISEVLEQLKRCPVGLDKVLARTVAFGVAFHHAGLTMDERDIIEGAFRSNILRVLVATSTLSSGVNLPARRVIIRSPIFNGKPLNTLTYKQMIGRAGRMGKDSAGESVLICQRNDYKVTKELLSADLEHIESCLLETGKLKRAILEVIASGVASSPSDVSLFADCTLLSLETDLLNNPIDEAVQFLENNEFIRLQDAKYIATPLAKACLSSSLPPEEGIALFAELEKARRCFVLETDLHLIYLVTPYTACNQWASIDWLLFLEMWEKLPKCMKLVGELVGIQESYIINASRGNTGQAYRKLQTHKRFYTALALQELVNEVSLNDVAVKFKCNRGMLQSLQQSASTFAGMVTLFSKQLGWTSVEILISQFQARLHFGVNYDLLDLMRLPLLNGLRARTLYNNGIETLVDLASSDPSAVETILLKALPFESEKERDGESEYEAQKRNKLRTVWITGQQGLTEQEAAEMLVHEARQYLKFEIGLAEAKWEKSETIKCDAEIVTNTNLHEINYEGSTKESEVIHKNESPCNSPGIDCDESDDSHKSSFIDDKSSNNMTFLEDAFSSSFSLNAPSDYDDGDYVIASQADSSFSLSSLKKRCRLSRNSIGRTQKKQKVNSPVDFTRLEIVDVCDDSELFNRFCAEIEAQEELSLSLACVEFAKQKRPIGSRIIASESVAQNVENSDCTYDTRRVKGISVAWGGNTAYYMSFHSVPVQNLLRRLLKLAKLKVKMFDCKEQIKALRLCCDIEFDCAVEDPKVGDWLLAPEGKEKNLQAMALKYLPEAVGLVQLGGHCRGVTSIGLDLHSSVDPRIRSSIEAIATWHLTQSLLNALAEQNVQLVHTYYVEMNVLLLLAKTELVGICLKTRDLQGISALLKEQTCALEMKAHQLAGRHFSFTSTIEVAKVLGLYRGKPVSTKKQVLAQSTHPIAGLILQWRKLNNTLSKMVYPMLQMVENDRLHGCYIVHNATGRISMHDPNLQNVPRNFDVFNPLENKTVHVKCRSAFACSGSNVLLSADYCQLELRLLAHLSNDSVLRAIMKSDEDLFKSIAAKSSGVSISEVTDELRQKAKQISYGIIYGMGVRGLSVQMGVSDDDASRYLQEFYDQYPGIKQYIHSTVKRCKEDGFVETIACRRRYLPQINHKDAAARSHAERQAVNTVIQGSAADIVKNAMVMIYKQMRDEFQLFRDKPRLVLHLHDELLYELPGKYLNAVAKIVKSSMENSVKLSVPFPVKIKTGHSWGDLKETIF